ncbi:MAG: GTP 3',8-cyclase MoaA [Thermoprotei archaeon]|nr:MAG: GTP 3',8-cyclase MoaA [Thermoprotei archaeon]
MPVDPYGRIIDYLRISVTQECNFKCVYCHKEGEFYDHKKYEMKPSDIEKIVRVAAKLGFNKVKLTGGEPLVREDIVEIVERIYKIKGITDISLTTNGYLLSEYAAELKMAGLSRINVSLLTLDSSKFKRITGVDGLAKVLEGIDKAIEVGLKPIKLNILVLKDFNESDVWDIINYAGRKGLYVQLIEYHDLNPQSDNFKRFYVNLRDVAKKLEDMAVFREKRDLQARPVYLLNSGIKVEIVKPMFNPDFCMSCKKLRVTSDGKFKPCFFRNDNLIDISYVLDGTYGRDSEKEIEKLLLKAIMLKKPFFE